MYLFKQVFYGYIIKYILYLTEFINNIVCNSRFIEESAQSTLEGFQAHPVQAVKQ